MHGCVAGQLGIIRDDLSLKQTLFAYKLVFKYITMCFYFKSKPKMPKNLGTVMANTLPDNSNNGNTRQNACFFLVCLMVNKINKLHHALLE